MEEYEESSYATFFTVLTVIMVVGLFRFMSFDDTLLRRVDMEPFSEPVQESIVDGVTFKKKLKHGYANITPIAEYKIYGRVYAHHYRPSKLYNADLYPYDVSIGFGPFQHREVYRNIQVKMASTVSYFSYSSNNWENHLSKYFDNHADLRHYFTNNHLCPANKKVARGIKRLRNKDVVYIEGYLIKYDYHRKGGLNYQGTSSTSRNDGFRGDNGSGNCEQIYVTRIVTRHGDYK